jgi:hypothetical protein
MLDGLVVVVIRFLQFLLLYTEVYESLLIVYDLENKNTSCKRTDFASIDAVNRRLFFKPYTPVAFRVPLPTQA